jgi:hypothetical protein
LWGGLGEDLVDELPHAANSLFTNHPEVIALHELTDFQAIGIFTGIKDQCAALIMKIISGLQFRSKVGEFHAEHGNYLWQRR